MKPYQEKLEGGYRLIRIRELKNAIYIFLIVLTFAGWAYIWFASHAGLKPFYAPLDAVVPWLLVMLLVIISFTIFFRDMEIQYAKRDSQRYLMASNTQRRAVWTIIIAIIVIVIAVLPPTSEVIENQFSSSNQILAYSSGHESYTMTNQDSLGLLKVDWLECEATSVSSVNVRIQIFRNNELLPFVEWRLTPTVPTRQMVTYNDGDPLHSYRLEIYNEGPFTATLTIRNHVKPAPNFTFTMPIILVFFIVVSVGYYFRLLPIKKKFAATSIYSIDYTQAMDKGEQVFSKYDIRASTKGEIAARNLPPPPEPSQEGPPLPPEGIDFSTGVTQAEQQPIKEAPQKEMAAGPRAFEAFIEEGSKMFAAANFEGALKNFDSALTMEPSSISALLARGSVLVKLERLKEALITFDKIITVESKNDKALRSKAVILIEMKQWADAVKALDLYLQVKPADADALSLKGDALMAIGKRQEAALAYETALNLKTGDETLILKLERAKLDVAALLSSAMVATASGNYAHALSMYDEILRLEPANTRALAGKAGALRRAGRKEEAIVALDSVLAIEPDNPGALLERARLLFDAGKLVEALDSAERLVKINENDARGWTIKGDLLMDQACYEEARDSYDRALKLEPTNPEILRKLENLDSAVAVAAQNVLTRELDGIKGMGPAKIRSLYESGYKTIEDLRKATVDELANVKGVSRKLAEEIVQGLKQ